MIRFPNQRCAGFRFSLAMTTTTKTIVSHLNTLIETCKDGEKGFTDAAEHVQDDQLRTLFTNYAAQRRDFALELQDLVTTYGKEPETESSMSSALHRTWIDFKSALTDHSNHAVLAECERGEDAIKKAYRDALLPDSGLTSDLIQIVSRQQEGINASHDRIKALRDSQ